MNRLFSLLLVLAAGLISSPAATVNWSAGINHGFSLANGTELAQGSLVRIGWFRNSGTGEQLTDAQIQAQSSSPSTLNSSFVEVATSTIGSGFTPAVTGHFAASSTADTGAGGLNVAGRQMYIWVLNAATLGAATQQAILYWDITNTSTNPDGTPQAPGLRWSFPGQEPVPGSTTIDITDLTTGTGSLASGAKLLVGTYPTGTSGSTSAANFGLAEFGASVPLQITTAANLPNGLANVAYNQSLAATGGTGPYTWAVTSGTLLPNLALGTDGVLSGTATSAAIFNFTAEVTDSLNAKVSKVFTLDIALQPLSVTTTSLPNGTGGQFYTQQLQATGGSPNYTWIVLTGSLPSNLNLSSAGVLSGTPSGTGPAGFTVRATDVSGRQATQALSLTINASPIAIATGTTLKNAFLTLPFSQTLKVTGGTAPFNWQVISGTPAQGLSLSASGVLSGTPTATGNTSFMVQVTDSNNLSATKSFTQEVKADLIAPVMDVPVFPLTMVSDGSFSYTLTANNNPKTFAATGLPAGLKLVAATGVISGRPSAAGVFNVQVKATNSKGTSPTVTARLVVQSLPSTVVGTYIGHITRQAGVNSNLGGRVDLTTSANGAYSLKITQGVAKPISSKGFLAATAGASPQLNLTSGSFQIALILNPADNTLGGTVTNGASSSTVTGWRRVWNTLVNPATDLAGYYTIGLDLTTDQGSTTVPQGTGFASFTIGLDGGLTIAGKTSDNNPISIPGFLGPNGEILVHQVLYKGLGSMVGAVSLAKDTNGAFEENTVSGNVTWFKTTTTSLTYPAPFGPLTIGVFGKYMAWSPKGSVVLGLPDTLTSASLLFAEGGVQFSNTDPDVSAFTYTGATAVPMPNTAQTNPGKATLTINAANGAVAGTFVLVEPAPALTRKVAFQGLIIRPASGDNKAFGYFMLPQIPVGSDPISKSPVKSGQVVISQPAVP